MVIVEWGWKVIVCVRMVIVFVANVLAVSLVMVLVYIIVDNLFSVFGRAIPQFIHVFSLVVLYYHYLLV